MKHEFSYIQSGLSNELAALTLDEVCDHYKTHIDSYLLDDSVGSFYFNRFATDEQLGNHQEAINCFLHLINNLRKLDPFNTAVLDICHQVSPSPQLAAQSKILSHAKPDSSFMLSAERMVQNGQYEKARKRLMQELAAQRGNIHIADALLELDCKAGFSVNDWLDSFTPPPKLSDEWNQRVAYMLSRFRRAEDAIQHFEAKTTGDLTNEILLNAVATSYLQQGDTQTAEKLLGQSLQITPLQPPVQRLAGELASPFSITPEVLENKKIVIAIYSYNKAPLLKQTLESLSRTQLGNARCVVLLNGCTDESAEIVRELTPQFGSTSLECINLPVNIGAPAARNYLIHHALSDTETEYVAFLDDDVTLETHWLPAMVTAIEEDSAIGAVGCKIMNPAPDSLQYIYRNVSIAKAGLFRLSLSTPFWTTDNGMYDVRRDVDSIMGCCHLIRRECLEKIPEFDIRFSPSQLDDVAFHLDLRLLGYKVRYLGQLSCCHFRSTGFENDVTPTYGNSLGNDVKFYYRFEEHLEQLKSWQLERNSSLQLGVPQAQAV